MANVVGTPVAFGTPNNTSTAAISTTLASTTVGHVAYTWISTSDGTAAPPTMSSAPVNHVLVGTNIDAGSNSNRFWLYRRVIDVAEPIALTWTLTGGSNTEAIHWCASGVDPVTPEQVVSVDPHGGAGAARTTAAPNTTTPGTVWSGFCDRSNSSFTGPSPADTLVLAGTTGTSSVYVQASPSLVAAGTPIAARTINGAATSIGGSFILVTNEAPGGITVDPAITSVAVPAQGFTTAVDPYRTALLTRGKPYVLHRLGSNNDPFTWGVEHTLKAAQSCAALGAPLVEISFWLDLNGVPIGSHDRDLLRVYGVSADITTYTFAQLQALTPNGTIDGRVGGVGYPLARVADLIAALPASTVILLDNKRNLDISAVMAFITSYPNYQGRFIMKGAYNSGTNPATSTVAAARQLGMHAWGYYDEADLGSLDTTWTAFDYLGLNYNASAPAWAQIKAKGLPVWAHVPDTAAKVATGFANGADGVMTAFAGLGGYNILTMLDPPVIGTTAGDFQLQPSMIGAVVGVTAGDLSMNAAPAGAVRPGTVRVATTRSGTVI